MPKFYKTFEIPTGQDEADIPFIFEQFIDSGLKAGSVVAHFDSFANANAAIKGTNFPNGSFAWIQAVLCKSNGTSWEPLTVTTDVPGGRFLSKADRDAFYTETGTGGKPVAGQVAMVGVDGQVNMTLFDGIAWTDRTDLMIRRYNLEGTHESGKCVSIGDPNNPHKMGGGAGFRKAPGWAVELAGKTFIDGGLDISVGGFNLVNGTLSANGPSHVINGSLTLNSTAYTAPIHVRGNIYVEQQITGASSVEGRGGLYGPSVYVNNIIGRSGEHLDVHCDTTIHRQPVIMAGHTFINGSCIVGGGVVAGGGFQVSDRRLKSDVRDAPSGALNLVKSIPVKSFTKDSVDTRYGWIAQEVETTLPTAVAEFDAYDEARGGVGPTWKAPDGTTIRTIKALNVDEMAATLWKAVQELSAEVEQLRAQIGSST